MDRWASLPVLGGGRALCRRLSSLRWVGSPWAVNTWIRLDLAAGLPLARCQRRGDVPRLFAGDLDARIGILAGCHP